MSGKNNSSGARRSELIYHSQNYEDQRDLQPITENKVPMTVSEDNKEDGIQIIFENVQEYAQTDFKNMIPGYLATYEDINQIINNKDNVRYVDLQSKSQNYVGRRLIEGEDGQIYEA